MLEQQQPINRSAYKKVDVNEFITKYCSEPSHKTVLYPKTELEDMQLNSTQRRLYKEAMYGLRAYPAWKLSKISDEEKEEISVKYIRTQDNLNKWKQKIIRDLSVVVVLKYWNNPFARLFVNHGLDIIDNDFKVQLTFKDLKISKKEIIAHLIKCRILPRNFYELN